MLPKNLLYLLAALMLILWAGQPVQARAEAGTSLKKEACSDLWPVEQHKKWGYIDKTGRVIIPFKFSYATGFSEGLAGVEMGGDFGYIDKTGKFVIPPQFHWGNRFSDGLAVAVMRRFDQEGKVTFKKFGYIDRSGKMVIEPRDVDSPKWLSDFSEGMACLMQGEKIGYIDKTGRQVIPPIYEDAFPFHEGLAAVTVDGKFGYLDKTGKMVIPPQFKTVGPFREGLAYAESGGKCGFIDKSGKMVLQGEEFIWARGFSQGLAPAQGKNDKYGFIDKTGKFAIPPRFDRVGDFADGLAPVQPVKDASWPGNLSYINQKGQIVIKSRSTFPDSPMKAEFDLHNYRFCGGIARVNLGKKEDTDAGGYINQEGKLIWPKAGAAQKEKR